MASRSLNRVTLIGNLTRDPELKYTPAGTAVCTFGVATNRSWTTTDGQIKEDTQYHRIVAWQKLAELCGKLLTKGKKVYLEGRITYRTFTGKDNQQRTIAEIVLDDFIVFSSANSQKPAITEETAEETKTADDLADFDVAVEETPQPEKKRKAKAEAGESKTGASEDVNPDDIPF